MFRYTPASFVPKRTLFVSLLAAFTLIMVDVSCSATTATAPSASITASATRVTVGQSVTLKVAVRRGAPGQEVTLQRKRGTHWTRVATRNLPRDGRIKRVAFTRTLSSRGYYTYRARLAAKGKYSAAKSGSVTVRAVSSVSYSCVTSRFDGRCGPFRYPMVTGASSRPYVDQNVWAPISGQTQTLSANSPGDWKVVSKIAAGNSAVTAYPNTGAPFDEAPLASFSSIVGSFAETMPHTAGTSAWAAYDIWLDDWKYEVMIQHDFVGNGPCDYVAVATFGGSNGVPSRLWGLCTYGSELIWKLAAPGSTVGTHKTVNQSSGSVDLKEMLTWLVQHGYMAADPTITNVSYGWEICSTDGAKKTFSVSDYSLTATPVH